MNKIRLQKYLSQIGFASRRQVEKFIVNGWIKINDTIITDLAFKFEPKTDQISFNKQIKQLRQKYHYYIYNKPKKIVTVNAQKEETEIKDVVTLPGGVVPVGRLDKMTTGIILLTNDPVASRRLMDPDFYHEKEYIVEANKILTPPALKQLASGPILFDKRTRPAKIKKISSHKFSIILTEGKNRQIHRLCEIADLAAKKIHRIRIANLQLFNLPVGKLRKLTPEIVKRLKKDLKIEECNFKYF